MISMPVVSVEWWNIPAVKRACNFIIMIIIIVFELMRRTKTIILFFSIKYFCYQSNELIIFHWTGGIGFGVERLFFFPPPGCSICSTTMLALAIRTENTLPDCSLLSFRPLFVGPAFTIGCHRFVHAPSGPVPGADRLLWYNLNYIIRFFCAHSMISGVCQTNNDIRGAVRPSTEITQWTAQKQKKKKIRRN